MEGFAAYQQKRRNELWGLLGDLPPLGRPQARLAKTEEGPGYTLEHLELELNGIEPVPALLLVPHSRRQPAPAILYIHAHGGKYDFGKEELIEGREMLGAYAPVCAEKGLVALAIDSWCFSGRKHKLSINLCCLTDYEELIKIDNLAGHSIYYYVPGLLKHFQAHEICELIVPRPHLSLNGRKDLLTPPAGVERSRDHLLPLYRKYGKEEDCRIELFDCDHEETPQMRSLVLSWLDKHLL